MIGYEAKRRERSRSENAYPGKGLKAEIGLQQEIQQHGNRDRKCGENRLPQVSPKNMTSE